MKFEEMPLVVPNLKKAEKTFSTLENRIINAQTKEEAIKVVKDYFKASDELESEITIISIRNSIDTRDETYEKNGVGGSGNAHGICYDLQRICGPEDRLSVHLQREAGNGGPGCRRCSEAPGKGRG